MSVAMIEMTPAARKAVELHGADLGQQFRHVTEVMYTAKAVDDRGAWTVYYERHRDLYREIREVECALRIGMMPASVLGLSG
jgi:hypothetical protein